MPRAATIEGTASFVGTRGSVVADASPDRYVYYQARRRASTFRPRTYEGKPVSAKVTLEFVERTMGKDTQYEGERLRVQAATRRSSPRRMSDGRQRAGRSYDYPITIGRQSSTSRPSSTRAVSRSSHMAAICGSTDRSNAWAGFA